MNAMAANTISAPVTAACRPDGAPGAEPQGTTESAFLFECEGEQLVGVIAAPARPLAVGVLIVVGGPQYRAGSHRQFVHLARALASAGIACMRFDYRGMGDSSGSPARFDRIDADIRAAIDAFMSRCPQLARVVLWGLCDGASAICFYAGRDGRVAGVVLANPWVRTAHSEAQARLRHYYGARLLDREFWRKLGAGGVDVVASLREFSSSLRRVGGRAMRRRAGADSFGGSLPDRMADGLSRFPGGILVLLSENDLTAQEFIGACASSKIWSSILRRTCREQLVGSDHTFSRIADKQRVADLTASWVRRR